MPEPPRSVTLDTLHQDLTTGFAEVKDEMRAGFTDLKDEMRAGFADLKREMRAGFTDLKTTMFTGFRGLPSRESADEMVRLLRESNRLQAERFAARDHQDVERHQETMTVLRALANSQQALHDEVRSLSEVQRRVAENMDALMIIIRNLFRGRRDGRGGGQ